ncbi:envelope biogenesis factor ElyC [Thalassotalea psychrophila]|uniref:Envelope biogenesis factor ElyC n=1 Tax=Thalassotalea psychrophila TaxID=3065647 RepID=A0ABY9TYZ0_9GAMM|nr:envelope biogenesis factor ElyC [Colwelliaceae bacterium SQ149]
MDLFTLKKIIGELLMPLPIIIITLLVGLLLFKHRPAMAKAVLSIATLALLLLSYMPVANRLIVNLEQQFPVYTPIAEKLDYIVILGCGHTSDTKLAATQELKICSLQRLTEGLRIANLHPEAIMITSGAAIYDISSNAEKVKQAAVELGFDGNNIITESRPKDTEDEALYISPLLIDKNFVLITNANHMPRSMTYFENQGVKPIAAPTGYYVKNFSGNKSWQEHFPDANELQKSQSFWYETLGLIWQWVKS